MEKLGQGQFGKQYRALRLGCLAVRRTLIMCTAPDPCPTLSPGQKARFSYFQGLDTNTCCLRIVSCC